MAPVTTTINGHMVIRDEINTWRWFEAFGPAVTRWEMNPYTLALATNATITNYTVTAVGTSPMTMVAGAEGGALLMTTGGTDNNGVQFQPVTEGFYFAQRWPAYFGAKFSIDDADQSDIFLGLSITDTDAATAVSDGIYFASVDESTSLTFNAIKTTTGATTSSVAAATLTDGGVFTVEFFFDGNTLTGYVNGAEVGSVDYTSASMPNDEYLTPMIAVLTGEGNAAALTVYWAKALQIRAAS